MLVNCECCGKEIGMQETFTLTSAGPVMNLKLYCEPCVDTLLEQYRKNLQVSEKNV